MIVLGRERKFLRTVGATCDIEDICPKGDIRKFNELFKGNYRDTAKAMATLVSALNKGYEMHTAMEKQALGESYKAEWLTVDQCLSLDDETLRDLFSEAADAMAAGAERTVEAKPKSVKKTEEPESK